MAIDLVPQVTLGGSALADSWLAALTEIRVELQYQVPGRVTLRFADPGYTLVDSGTAALGGQVEVKDPSGQTSIIKAEITGIAVEQHPGAQPELVVTAHDRSHRLGRSSDVKSYVMMKYSDAVSQLATAGGLSPSVDATTDVIPYFVQADSGLGLLSELAQRVGFDWWVTGTQLHFAKPAAGTTIKLSMLNDDVRSFSVKATGHHADTITVDGWDRAKQTLVTGTGTAKAVDGVTSTASLATTVTSPGSAFGSATVVTNRLGAQTASEASDLATALATRGVAGSVVAQGVVGGDASITLGSVVSMSDAGNSLSGSYPVTKVEHVFRPLSGFITKFTSGNRRPTTLVDTLGGNGARAGMAPVVRQAGVVVGQVTNIDQTTGRVKVCYPALGNASETGWARVVAVGGGTSRGSLFIPEVGDEVLVAFEGGDPRQPVVIGGLYGQKTKAPSTLSIKDGAVQNRGITSRLGHSILLYDGTETAQQSIELALAGGQHKLHMGKDKTTLTLPSGYEFSITVGDSSIKFDTTGNLTVSAPKITLTADEQVSISGSTQVSISSDTELSLSGDVTAALKGGEVQVQAEGPLQAQGEPVTIN